MPSQQVVKTLKANTAITATDLSASLDISDYEGTILIILDASAQGSGITNAIKVQESAATAGTYTDVSGGGFTSVTNTASKQTLTLNSDGMMQFIKLSQTVSGGSGTGNVACSVVGKKKYSA